MHRRNVIAADQPDSIRTPTHIGATIDKKILVNINMVQNLIITHPLWLAFQLVVR